MLGFKNILPVTSQSSKQFDNIVPNTFTLRQKSITKLAQKFKVRFTNDVTKAKRIWKKDMARRLQLLKMTRQRQHSKSPFFLNQVSRMFKMKRLITTLEGKESERDRGISEQGFLTCLPTRLAVRFSRACCT